MEQLDERFVWAQLVNSFLKLIFGFFFLFLPSAISFRTLIKEFDWEVSGSSFTLFMIFLFIVFSIIMFVLTYFEWKYYRFTLTEKTFNKEFGVIRKQYVSIPYGRIQNVDINRGLLERMFGLSTVTIQTAGASGFVTAEGRLPGISKERAFTLKEELLKKMNEVGSSKNTNSGM
jgi:membrane protein YdbS with pleckstrin-like domain